MSIQDELLQQFNEAFAQEYTSWDDISREDLLYYLRVLLIERKTRPSHVGPYGDGFPGCLLMLPKIALTVVRRLLLDMWDNSDLMADPENYGWGDKK